MKTFEPGKTYYTHSIGDSECIFRITIASRTAKTVTTTEGKTLRPAAWYDNSCEFVKPFGSYSMAPMIRADREVKP